MQKIVKNTLLDYLPNVFKTEETPHPARVFELNKNPFGKGDVVYLMERELRFRDNFSLSFALNLAKELHKKLRIVHVRQNFETELKRDFYEKQLDELKKCSKAFDFEVCDEFYDVKAGAFVLDFNPIAEHGFLKSIACRAYEVDSHNIVPARFVSDKQEYNAATFRRKVYRNIYEFLTEFPKTDSPKTAAELALEDFVQNKLDLYAELKNDPQKDATSNLSKFLNLGFLSAQRVALEVVKSASVRENKEEFLEELVVRGELSDNFCLYSPSFKTFASVPTWAQETLAKHSEDFRPYVYTRKDFETAKTHDPLWNYAQSQLLKTGKIHGYLRMFWAKKILEWSKSPNEALKTAIYLNDKYALDAPSPNGYVGILWSMGALHDRAFSERPIIGKIRPMTCKNIKL